MAEVSVHVACSGPATSLGLSSEGQHTPTKEIGFGFFSLIPSKLFSEHKSACGYMWARPKSGMPGLCKLE